MAVQALSRMHHVSRFEPLHNPLWQDAGCNTTSAGVPAIAPSAPAADADASLAILFQLEMEGREAAKSGGVPPPRQITAVLDRLRALTCPDSNFEARLARDSRYYSAVVLEEEGAMCAVVLASKLAQVGYRVSIRTALGGGPGLKAFSHLSHEFLVVAPPGHSVGTSEVIVDPHFREQFDIPQAVGWYRQVLAALPSVYAGNASRLKAMVRLVCVEMGAAFAERGTVTPPWRSTQSLLSKWLPTKARDTSVSDALGASPPSSRRSPTARSQTGRSLQLPGIVEVWPTHPSAQRTDQPHRAIPKLDNGIPQTFLRSESSTSGPRGVSDSDEDLYSSPDTTLLYPGFPGSRNTDPVRKIQASTRTSSFKEFPDLLTGSVPVSAASGVSGRPALRRSSLTQAMQGEKASTPAAVKSSVDRQCAGGGPISTQLLSGNLRSVSEPGFLSGGGASTQHLPAHAAVQDPAGIVRRRLTTTSLLSSNIAAALKLPKLSQQAPNSGVPYTLTASDAAAIAAAQQNTHPTVRGAVRSPLSTHTPKKLQCPPSNEQETFAAKVAALRTQELAPVKIFNGATLPESPGSDTGPTVDAPFWSQPVIQEYIKHSQHGGPVCNAMEGGHNPFRSPGAAGAQRSKTYGQGGDSSDGEPRIRTVKMRGAHRGP